MFKVYKITNLINGKGYVGRTKRSLAKRFKEHIVGRDDMLISRAIKKHGKENFNIELVYECDNAKEVERKEEEFIIKFNTMSPYGYNLTYFCGSSLIRHKKSREKVSRSNQGKKNSKNKKYIGVYSVGRVFMAQITILKKKYEKYFLQEVEAAKAYDRMALFLYGEKARINFENDREIYLLENLEYFFKKEHTNPNKRKGRDSKYLDVCLKESGLWRVKLYNIRNIERGTFTCSSSEEEIAELRDKFVIWKNLDKPLNFPEKLEYYKSLDLESFFKQRIKNFKLTFKPNLKKE